MPSMPNMRCGNDFIMKLAEALECLNCVCFLPKKHGSEGCDLMHAGLACFSRDLSLQSLVLRSDLVDAGFHGGRTWWPARWWGRPWDFSDDIKKKEEKRKGFLFRHILSAQLCVSGITQQIARANGQND